MITIPLRIGPYEMPPDIAEEDIILQHGDVVFVLLRGIQTQDLAVQCGEVQFAVCGDQAVEYGGGLQIISRQWLPVASV